MQIYLQKNAKRTPLNSPKGTPPEVIANYYAYMRCRDKGQTKKCSKTCVCHKKVVTSARPFPLGGFPPNLRSHLPGHTRVSHFSFTTALRVSDCWNAYVVRSWYVLSRGHVLAKGYAKTRRQGGRYPEE